MAPDEFSLDQETDGESDMVSQLETAELHSEELDREELDRDELDSEELDADDRISGTSNE